MKIITNEWLKSAEMDWKFIDAIFDRDDLTPLTAFHYQQIIEKTFKAVLEEYSFTHYKIHKLFYLYEQIGKIIKLELSEKEKMFQIPQMDYIQILVIRENLDFYLMEHLL